MEEDLAVLQNVSETLKIQPLASQRQLAKNAGMSLGMMNAILGRFVERGWIMLTNVNARKLAYAVTPEGLNELSERSKKFVKRTFVIANEYNDVLDNYISNARKNGIDTVVLYGKSYIKFLISYVCSKNDIRFIEQNVDDEIRPNTLCLVGELEKNNVQSELIHKGCICIVQILEDGIFSKNII